MRALSRGLSPSSARIWRGSRAACPIRTPLITPPSQKLDDRAERLRNVIAQLLRLRREQLNAGTTRLRPQLLKTELAHLDRRLRECGRSMTRRRGCSSANAV